MPYTTTRVARRRTYRPRYRRYGVRKLGAGMGRMRRYRQPSAAIPWGRLGSEIKSVDVTPANVAALPLLSAQAYAEPGAFTGYTVVNVVQQGAAVYNRIGTKITIKSIQCRAQFNGRTPATSNSIVRVSLVYDRQCNGAAPAVAAVWADLTTGGVSSTTPNCGLAIQNRSRFAIISDEFIPMSFGGNGVYNYKCYRTGGWNTEYGANAGNIGDITSGAIYLFISDSNGGAALGALAGSISVRIRYSD